MGLLFGAALAGAAQGYGKYIDEENKREDDERKRQQSIADRRDALLQEMALKEQYAIASEERTAARDDAKTKRLIDDTMKANARAEEIGTDRRFAKFKQDGLAAGYFEGMSDDEIKQAFKDNYDDRRVTNEEGGDRYQDKTREIKSQDHLRAAQETGNSGLIATSLKGVDGARAADVAESKERYLNRKAEETERKNREAERQRDERESRQHTEAMARAERDSRRLEILAARGTEKAEDPLKERNQIVREIKALESSAPKKPDTSKLPDRMKTKAENDWLKAYKDWLDNTDDGQMLKGLRERQRELMSTKPSESKPAGGQSVIKSLPKGAKQIGTSGGKPVYQTPDGKQFISE